MNFLFKNTSQFFRSGLLFGFGIIAAVGISIGVYATYSTLTASTNESLTVTKWNELLTYTVPPNIIAAFSGTICPPNWTEYTPARGRFLRGIDPSGSTLVDPSGTRVPGDQQVDDFRSHTHDIVQYNGNFWNPTGASATNSDGNGQKITTTNPQGGAETRPKNVAVLYCIKN